MSTSAGLFTIGRLAERCGLPARTIRFWSDAGLVPPAGRSAGGYRLYDAESVARLELVRTLRELGLGLDVVEAVLAKAVTVGEVASAHVTALDAEIRTLRLRRAVLSTVAGRASTIEETLLMHKLAQMSAQERQQIIDDFVQYVVAGTPAGRWRRESSPARPRPEPSSTGSSRRTPRPRSEPAYSSSSRRSSTLGWSATGSYWRSSTAARHSRRPCPASSG